MKVFLRASAAALAAVFFLALGKVDVNAATGLYVGKDVSGDNTTLVGVTSEYDVGISTMPEVFEKGRLQKGDVIRMHNGYEYTLPEESAKMTVVRAMSYSEIPEWNLCATNEYGVSVLATITTSPNSEAAAADPFVADGICEEKIPQLLAANSRTAKDAVNLLCSIYDEAGAENAEIVLIADQDGAWAVENFTGHQYAAVKLPDDKIGVFGSEPIIRTADPDDADTICSPQLFSLPKDNDFAVYDENKDIDLILTYNEDNRYSDEAHLRVWVGHDVFAASEELDYDESEGYDVFFAPDDDVTIAKAFDFFRNRYEGTPFDLNDNDNSYYWGISNQTVSNAAIVQIFGDVPAPMSTVIWDTPANPAASPFIPVIAYADTIPACFTTDIADAGSADGTLQYDFIRLADKAVFRRNSYGRSIKEYWEGMEAVSAAYVADAMEGRWKETYDESPAKAATEFDDYMYKIVSESQENCVRITDELDWFMFRNGVVSSDIPDDQAATFECSFDAVSYAHANGWETTVEDDTFTATKDGKTIEVVLSGENEGNVTFKGFDNKKLMEDFMTDDTVDEGETDSDDSIPEGETVEEAEEKIEEAVEENREEEKAEEEKAEEEKAEDKKAEDKKAEEEKAEEEKAEEKKAEEKKAEDAAAEPAPEETADTGAEKAAQDVAAKLEVDTIAELESYFAEKIAGVPRDGWAEAEIAGQLGGVADDVSAIILKHFSVDDIDDLLTMDYAKIGNDIASDPAIADAADRLANAGIDLAGLTEKYFLSLSDEVAADVVSGRLSQDGAVKILDETATDIEGIAKLYIEGVEGAFSDVFGNITEEDLKEFLSEVDDAADVLDEYGVIDQKSLGLDQIELEDLTDADVNVVITLNEMDQDVIDGLSDMLGVDVGSIVNGYMDELSKAGRIDAAGNQIVVEESHEASTAQSAPDEEVMTAIEVEEALSEDDIVIPQEVIDLLNEAIAKAHSGDDGALSAEGGLNSPENVSPSVENGEFTISLGKLEKSGNQVLLPAYMLRYFN